MEIGIVAEQFQVQHDTIFFISHLILGNLAWPAKKIEKIPDRTDDCDYLPLPPESGELCFELVSQTC